MKSDKSYSARILILLFTVAGLIALGLFWWWSSNTPVDSTDKSYITIEIEKGDGVKSIAMKLYSENLIRSKTAFFILIKMLGIERQLQAGEFRFSPSMNAKSIAEELTHGTKDIWVTLLEGWRVEEIAQMLSDRFNIPESEFMRHAKEGYMFPDTYRIPKEATAAAITSIFMENFNNKYDNQLTLDAEKTGLTKEEIITLASIIEREGRSEQDRPVIAGILLKRLANDRLLQADATLQYALGYQSYEKSWWKKILYNEDKEIDSEYNTYKNLGLPPGPISNPGLSSIKAVINPTNSEYWYYLHDNNGNIHYAESNEGHNINIAKFLR